MVQRNKVQLYYRFLRLFGHGQSRMTKTENKDRSRLRLVFFGNQEQSIVQVSQLRQLCLYQIQPFFPASNVVR